MSRADEQYLLTYCILSAYMSFLPVLRPSKTFLPTMMRLQK